MSITHANDQNFEQEVKQADKPVIVDFWADWCQPCKMFGPIFEEVAQEYDGKVKFVKASTEEAQQSAGSMGVMSIPTIVFMKNGEEVNRVSGMMPKERLQEEAQKLLDS